MFFIKKNSNLSGSMFFSFMSHNRTFIIQFLCFHKSIREQNHIAPGIYIVNPAYIIKFIKMTTSLKHSPDRKHRNTKQ